MGCAHHEFFLTTRRRAQPTLLMIIRTAEPDDIPAMAQVEAASWPEDLAPSATMIESRLRAFAQGQLVAVMPGETVGVAAAQRVSQRFFEANNTHYDLLTDKGCFTNSHDPAGSIYQLIGVAVASVGRGLGLGRLLVDRQIEIARSLPGIRRIVGFTRPVRYSRHQHLSIEDYVNLRDDQERLIDPVLAFHLDAGARLVSIQPDFRPADTESCGYGVLIEYPV